MNDMKHLFDGIKHSLITWSSFAIFLTLEVAFIYGLFKLVGAI